MHVLVIQWATGEENELSFSSRLKAKRHMESMEIVFSDKINRISLYERGKKSWTTMQQDI